jgi:hypothetical protein
VRGDLRFGMIRFAALLFALALLFAPRLALAEKVAVLPFASSGNATSVDLDKAREATRAAIEKTGRTLPSSSEMLTAEMAFKGEHGGGTKGYQAAGRASSSDWTILGRVETHGATYRLELEACKVESGRVESIAREIEPAKALDQIAEMLALLLRPEGVANADIPWERATPVIPAKPAKPAQSTSTQVTTNGPEKPAEPAKPKHAYAENAPVNLAVGGAVFSAASRDSRAQGSATSGQLEVAGGYAFSQVPGLEARATIDVAVAGPQSFSADAGARFMLPIVPTLRVFAGPELALGLFATEGAEKTARFLARGALVGSVGVGERVQIEVAGDAAYAAGGSSGILLVGGALRGGIRF